MKALIVTTFALTLVSGSGMAQYPNGQTPAYSAPVTGRNYAPNYTAPVQQTPNWTPPVTGQPAPYPPGFGPPLPPQR